MDQATWACEGAADAPARLALRAGPVESRDLRLVFQDRDNAPLPAVDVTLWRRRHVLIFPWPQGEITLCAGARGLQAPSYDLEALREDIIARPAAEASAAPVEATKAGAGSWQQRPAARWVFLGALLAAAVVLLLILSRAMRQAPTEKG